jgi:alkylation response protein AidB-like acyl-CoA dehydrogenase
VTTIGRRSRIDTETKDLLTDEMLARFDERAPLYDRENRFFADDFEDFKGSGYLLAYVPTEFGGRGARSRRLLAASTPLANAAPATALAVDVHCSWTAVAAELRPSSRRISVALPTAGPALPS